MPTISTLDVKDAGSIYNPNFGYNVQQNIDRNSPNRAKYAFDAYFAAADVNEPHVQITNGQASTQGNPPYLTDNGSWIQNELRQSAHLLPARLTTTSGFTSTYNYASPYRHLLPSVVIDYAGLLAVNDVNLPVSGGDPRLVQVRQPAGNFELYTASCATVVKVNYNGVLRLGMPGGTPNTASLQVSANSLLDMQYGGRIEVNPGSVLRVVAGATLVVRKGATLNVSGQVIVDAGAYLCVEDAASIVRVGSGTYTASPAANYYANPAFNLGALACQQPGLPALQVSITTLAYNAFCTSPSGKNNYAEWTATASGGNGVYSYAWFLDANNTGNYQPVGGNGSSYGTCLNGRTTYVQVKVVVTSGTQTASATYYANPQLRVAMYPNPATSSVDFSLQGPDDAPGASAHSGDFQVNVYDGTGKLRWQNSTHTGKLRFNSADLPRGIYGIVVTKDAVVTRHNLSLE